MKKGVNINIKDEIRQIDDTTIERYNKRFEEYGIEARTLGWGCEKDQLTRFEAATTYTDAGTKRAGRWL